MLLSKTTAYCPGKMSLAETTFLPRTSLPVASTTAKPPLATAAAAAPPATAGAAGKPGWTPRACAPPAPTIAQAARATMRHVLLEPCADMVLVSISNLLAPAGRQSQPLRRSPHRPTRGRLASRRVRADGTESRRGEEAAAPAAWGRSSFRPAEGGAASFPWGRRAGRSR